MHSNRNHSTPTPKPRLQKMRHSKTLSADYDFLVDDKSPAISKSSSMPVTPDSQAKRNIFQRGLHKIEKRLTTLSTEKASSSGGGGKSDATDINDHTDSLSSGTPAEGSSSSSGGRMSLVQRGMHKVAKRLPFTGTPPPPPSSSGDSGGLDNTNTSDGSNAGNCGGGSDSVTTVGPSNSHVTHSTRPFLDLHNMQTTMIPWLTPDAGTDTDTNTVVDLPPIDMNSHEWKSKYLKKPTFCNICDSFIWGFTKEQQNAFMCVHCNSFGHRHCCRHKSESSECVLPPFTADDILQSAIETGTPFNNNTHSDRDTGTGTDRNRDRDRDKDRDRDRDKDSPPIDKNGHQWKPKYLRKPTNCTFAAPSFGD
jgi:hypothetical protein